MKVIGLCGGSGSGKGTVALIFAVLGIPSIDTDSVYHELTSEKSECLEALQNAFGKEIISENGALNRRILASIVFNSEDADKKRELLNEISHSYILAETRRRLAAYRDSGVKAAIVDAPLLFESGFDGECDLVIAVVAPRELRIDRIMRRDGINRARAEERIRSQISDGELECRSDFTIVNDGDEDSLRAKVFQLAEKIFEN